MSTQCNHRKSEKSINTPLPPEEILALLGVEKEKPELVYCHHCKLKGFDKLLFVKYGRCGFSFHSKGMDRNTGLVRGVWTSLNMVIDEFGHLTRITGDGRIENKKIGG